MLQLVFLKIYQDLLESLKQREQRHLLIEEVNRVESETGISGDLPAGSFGISEAGAREALTNRIESQTGIPANLPEGSFGITPKKKFNVPKIKKVKDPYNFMVPG